MSASKAFVLGSVFLFFLSGGVYGDDQKGGNEMVSNPFPVTVDYSRSLGQMITAGGYEVVAKEVTPEHYPVLGKGKTDIEVVVFHFNRKISIDGVLSEFSRLGYRAATLPELLAFAAKNPGLQREFPIVEFGSLWRNNDVRVAAYLRGTPMGARTLDINFVDNPSGGGGSVPWTEETRFLGVQISKELSVPKKK